MDTDVFCNKCRHFSGLPVRFHFAAYPVRYCDQAETFILGEATISKSCDFFELAEAEEKTERMGVKERGRVAPNILAHTG